MKLITAIIELIVRFCNFFLQNKEKTAEQLEQERRRQEDLARLKEDAELKDAIQRGDYETVNRIREKRKKYPNLKG